MTPLNHAIGFEEKKFSPGHCHRGAIVADSRDDRGAAQDSPQPGYDGIFAIRIHIR